MAVSSSLLTDQLGPFPLAKELCTVRSISHCTRLYMSPYLLCDHGSAIIYRQRCAFVHGDHEISAEYRFTRSMVHNGIVTILCEHQMYSDSLRICIDRERLLAYRRFGHVFVQRVVLERSKVRVCSGQYIGCKDRSVSYKVQYQIAHHSPSAWAHEAGSGS